MNRDEIEENEIDLGELFATIKNSMGTIFSITLFTIIIVSIYLYFAEPVYKANVIISLDNKEEDKLNKVLPGNLLSNKIDYLERLELAKVTIKSKKFISTIIDKVSIGKEFFIKRNFRKREVSEFSDIKLDIHLKDSRLYGEFFEIIPLNKNEFLLKINGREINEEKIKYYHKHRYNEKIDNKLFSLRIVKTGGISPFKNSIENKIINFFNSDIVSSLIKPRYYFRLFDRDAQAGIIIENITLSDLSSNILKIEYQDSMPSQTKEVTQEIAKSYIEYNLANKNSETEQTLEFLDKQIIDLKSNLKIRGDELKKYQQKSGTVVISTSADILKNLEKKDELIDKISRQIREVKRFKTSFQGGELSTVSLISAGIDTSSIQPLMESYRTNNEKIRGLRFQQKNIDKAVTSNTQINTLISELKKKELFIQSLLTSFTKEHPQVIEAEQELDNLKNKIHATIVAQIERLEKSTAVAKSTILNNINMVENNLNNRLKVLKSSVREKKSLLQAIPEKHMINENLKRNFALSSNTYNFLERKKIEMQISKASTIANTKILEDAYTPTEPISPKKKLLLIISAIVGFILGLFYIFIREIFDTKIRNVKDIGKNTKIPIYGVLPLNSNERFFNEALRVIRTNLQFIIPKNSAAVNILISSSVASEGKTTISANLAKIISYTNKKVLVMDLDFRKPRLYKELKQSNRVGMSNYLTNNIEIKDIIQPISENLDFFPAGSIPPNPSELLMSEKFNQTIKELEKIYDYIIFDSAPIGTVTDTHIILKHTDISLLVVKANMTEKVYLENFNKMVKEKNIKSSGIILNGVKFSKSKGYGYGYGYGYDYGYGYEEKKDK